ncbi:MAG: hypothetical protein CMK32_02420 [Porticoccaceae bacterium]|nr:hypothetical protein [Porticoccaceae bacterium]
MTSMAGDLSTGDEEFARSIADQMRENAGQQGATRVAAKYFGENLESHHYPPSPGDGVLPGPAVARAIRESLPKYQKIISDYQMDEAVSVEGPIVNVTANTNGFFADGSPFHDVSQVAYRVRNGKIVRADAIHTNPGAISKALAGDGGLAASDHESAMSIANKMRDCNPCAMDISGQFFADRVATWSFRFPDKNKLYHGDELRELIRKRFAKLEGIFSGYREYEEIDVDGNTIHVAYRIAGKGQDDKPLALDAQFRLSVTRNAIVGIEWFVDGEGPAKLKVGH